MLKRTPTSVSNDDTSTSAQVARTLREAPVALPEMTRARLERNLVEAWRARGAHAIPLPRLRPGLSRGVWIGSLAGSAALGVVLGFMLLRQPPAASPAQPAASVAHFDLVIGDGAVQSGVLVAGQVLESGKHGHIEVTLGQSRVDIAPESRVRFERLDPKELRLSLVQGRVDVAYHPERRGEESLSVETSSARVVVVGTRFAVEAAANRETRVSVSEGVVRVEPRRGGAPLLVRAGEQVTVNGDRDAAVAKEPLPEEAPLTAAEPTGRAHAARSSKAMGTTARSDARLESARNLLLKGKHAQARETLQRVVRGSGPANARVEAYVLMAESYTAQGQVPRAAASYRKAADTAAPQEAAGHNALFALARLLDRYTQDNDGAAAAYREYLTKAPHGALARQARDALCRLDKCP